MLIFIEMFDVVVAAMVISPVLRKGECYGCSGCRVAIFSFMLVLFGSPDIASLQMIWIQLLLL